MSEPAPSDLEAHRQRLYARRFDLVVAWTRAGGAPISGEYHQACADLARLEALCQIADWFWQQPPGYVHWCDPIACAAATPPLAPRPATTWSADPPARRIEYGPRAGETYPARVHRFGPALRRRPTPRDAPAPDATVDCATDPWACSCSLRGNELPIAVPWQSFSDLEEILPPLGRRLYGRYRRARP